MELKRVNIDGAEYVPVKMLHMLAPAEVKEAAALVRAAIDMVRADEAVDRNGGLERLDKATTRLKRAVRAFERRAAKA